MREKERQKVTDDETLIGVIRMRKTSTKILMRCTKKAER